MGGCRKPSNVICVEMGHDFYFTQLVLNVLWSAIFFGLRRPGAALAEIILLWLAILLTIVRFWQISPTGRLANAAIYFMGQLCRLFKLRGLAVKF